MAAPFNFKSYLYSSELVGLAKGFSTHGHLAVFFLALQDFSYTSLQGV